MNKRKYSKVAVSSLAAVTAAAAVAPVVSAETDVSFSDVTKEKDASHYDNIMNLAGQGVIQGYQDGTFQPGESITRGQVAAMLTNALNLDVPEDLDKALDGYTDVNSDSFYAEQMAAVTEAGIFIGQDGKFNPKNNIMREQMATVLVEGFGLSEYDTGEDVDLNTDNIWESHLDNIQTIANLGITGELDDYRPRENTSRAQFSTMFVLTQEILQTVEDVEVTANDDGTVTVAGIAPDGVSDGAHIILKNDEGEAVVDNMVSLNEDNSFEFTTELLKEGTYSYTVMAMNGEDGHGTANAKTGDVDATFAVNSVSTTSDEIDLKSTLGFTVNGDENYASLEDLKDHGYKVEFKSTEKVLVDEDGNKAYTNSTGKVDATGSDIDNLEYQVVISKDGKDVAETDRVKVGVVDKANAVTEINGFEITKGDEKITNGQLALNDDNIAFDTNVTTSDGEEKKASDLNGVDVTYESEHPAILKFNQDGSAKIGTKGDTVVTVTVGDKEYTQTINVGEKRMADASNSSLAEDTVKFATGDDEKHVAFELKDQYAQAYDASNLADEVSAETDNDKLDVGINSDEDSSYVSIKATEETTGEVDVMVNGDKLGTIQVEALNQGEATSFDLTAEDEEFDLNNNDQTKDVTFHAYDDNGLEVDAPQLHTENVNADKDAKYVLNSSNSDVLEIASEGDKATGVKLADSAKAGDTADVYVSKKAGAFNDKVEGTTVTFTVVDSTITLQDITLSSIPAITEETVDLDLAEYITPMAVDSEGNAADVGYSVSVDVDTSNIEGDSLGNNNVWIVAHGEDGEDDVAIGKVTFMGNPLDDDALHVGQAGSQEGVHIDVSDGGNALEVTAEQGDSDIDGTLNIDFANAEGSHEFDAFQNVDVNIAGK